MFISFEGPEGSGKSTQAARLIARLQESGHEVVHTREPGGTATGEAIRNILQHHAAGEDPCDETEVLLFAASRAQLVRRVILPALEQGRWVVCDRFADSTTAYQGYGRGFPVEKMLAINDFAIGAAIPDLTLLLDLCPEAGLERVRLRAGGRLDRIEQEAVDFHHRVREGYLEMAARWPDRYQIIDADRDEDMVAAEIWDRVRHAL